MKKKWCLFITIFATFAVLFLLFSSRFFWQLPFIPASIKNSLSLNASIFPASDDSRSLFLSVNPNFRAEFGDREATSSAFLRFEVTDAHSASVSSNLLGNSDIDTNTLVSWDQLYQAFQTYQPGIEWQLFSVGIDETQLQAQKLGTDTEILRLLQDQSSGTQSLISATPTDVATVLSYKENVTTKTQVSRQQGYDVIENLAVAKDIDLAYKIDPGQGITQQIIIGDRQNFDTACLQLLSLGLPVTDCDLPNNRFAFLLKLDEGQTLIHSPLSIDSGVSGTYYVSDGNAPLLRFTNPVLTDNKGASSPAVTFTIVPATLDGQIAPNYYVATITADLGWLLDSSRQFPLTVSNGFSLSSLNFFADEINE